MATVLWLALLLCVGGALAQDLMLPSINIIEELGKLKRMEERLKAMEGTMQSQSVLSEQLRRMEERLKAMEGTMQSQSVLSEQLRRMEERLKAMEGTMQKLSTLVEQLQKESKDLKPGQPEDAGNPPISNVAQCKPLPTIPNGDVTEAPDGMSLTVECARFYKLIGPEQVMCVRGRWSRLPECKVAECKPIPTIPNGDVTEAPDGMSLTVECAQFYKLIGPEHVTCVRGRWSRLPECKEDSGNPAISNVAGCKPLPTIPNGDVTEAPDGMSLTVECAKFYQLIGPEQVTCVRGDWSKLPECKEGPRRPPSHVSVCGTPLNIENGRITYTPDGMEMRIRCADHHKRIGPERVWCVERKWTELPVCKARCKLDPKMTYYYSERYMEHGTEEGFFCTSIRRVYIKCNDGRAFYRGCGRNDW